MADWLARLCGRRRVPPIEGAFSHQSGYVKGQVLSGPGWRFDVTFKIDTGSTWTVLLDNDFLNACKALGWTPHTDPDILNWIRVRPNLFQNIGSANTVGGPTDSIYLIKGVRLRYYQPDGQILDNKWQHRGQPLHGTFSRGFARRISGPHHSLLGGDHLNELRQMLWSCPRKQIHLTP